MARIAVVIVTHNSECCLGRCLAGLSEQQEEVQCILVDAGSSQTAYLDGLDTRPGTQLIRTTNIGFAAANNLGYRAIPEETECVVFLNPDAFLEPGTLGRARAILAAHPRVGCLSGLLLGWDLEADRPSGRIDSTGIFRRWYGRWYDRGQGEVFSGQYDRTEVVLPRLLTPEIKVTLLPRFVSFIDTPVVEVSVRYEDAANQIRFNDSFLFTEPVDQVFRIPVRADSPTGYELQITYFNKDGTAFPQTPVRTDKKHFPLPKFVPELAPQP